MKSFLFSGDSSKALWEKIESADSIPKLRAAIYRLCCAVDELEERLFAEGIPSVVEVEPVRVGRKPTGKAMTNSQRQEKWRAKNLEIAKERQRSAMKKIRSKGKS